MGTQVFFHSFFTVITVSTQNLDKNKTKNKTFENPTKKNWESELPPVKQL